MRRGSSTDYVTRLASDASRAAGSATRNRIRQIDRVVVPRVADHPDGVRAVTGEPDRAGGAPPFLGFLAQRLPTGEPVAEKAVGTSGAGTKATNTCRDGRSTGV